MLSEPAISTAAAPDPCGQQCHCRNGSSRWWPLLASVPLIPSNLVAVAGE